MDKLRKRTYDDYVSEQTIPTKGNRHGLHMKADSSYEREPIITTQEKQRYVE